MQSFINTLFNPLGSQLLAENLLQHGLFLPQFYRICQQTSPCMGSSLQGSTDPARILQTHVFYGVTTSFKDIHLLWHGVLHGLKVDLCSTMILHCLQGHTCLTMICTRGCRRISSLVPSASPALLLC